MRQHLLDKPISYYAIFIAARVLPIRVSRAIGRLVASIVYIFSDNDRKGFAYNLSLALGKPADDMTIRRTIRKIFVNYGEYMADFFILPQLPPHKIRQSFAYLKGERVIEEALAKGRGAIMLSAHIGNWEFGGIMMRLSDYPLAVVALPHNTEATNALVNRFREGRGIEVIEVDDSPFSSIGILKHLRKNGVVAMIGDRDFFDNGMPITFLGKQVRFPVGPVAIAMSSGASLIPAFVLKQEDGRYFGILEEAVQLSREGTREQMIKANLHKVARVFETYIRRYPDQWYSPDPISGKAVK